MSTALQLRRGSSTQNDSFRGYEGEITVDTTTWSIRIHDGITRGGHLLGTQGARVTSVGLDATALGFTVANSPVLTSGTLRLEGILKVSAGGTGTDKPAMTATSPLAVSGKWPNQAVYIKDIIPIIMGGTGTANPSLVEGTGVSITGTWPNQTINALGKDYLAGTNISLAGDTISLTGFVAVANGGTGTNNPVLTGAAPISVTGTWPNNTISLAGTVPVVKGGTGTSTPGVASTDGNIVITGVWPNNRFALNTMISVNTLRPVGVGTTYPSITMDPQDNSVTINADSIKFRYGSTASDTFSDQGQNNVSGLLVAFASNPNTAYSSPSGIGPYAPVFVTSLVIDTDGGLNSFGYTATKSGYYRVDATVLVTQSAPTQAQKVYLQIQKNGIEVATVEEPVYNSGMAFRKSIKISAIVELNGTNETVSLAFATNVQNITYETGQAKTYFTVSLIK